MPAPRKRQTLFFATKTLRRICRSHAAKNKIIFSRDMGVGENTSPGCQCGILPLAAKLCAKQPAKTPLTKNTACTQAYTQYFS